MEVLDEVLGLGLEVRNSERFSWITQINKIVRSLGLLFYGGFSCSNIQAPVDLAGVGTEDDCS